MRSAQDEIADQRFAEVHAAYDHDFMLKFSHDKDNDIISLAKSNIVLDMSVANVLVDNFTQLYEAMSMWSDVRRHEQAAIAKVFSAMFHETLFSERGCLPAPLF